MNDKLTDFQQLHVWQKAHQMVLKIYEITRKITKDEKAELAARLRSSAMTVPVKIAEGFMRRNPKDKFDSYKESQDAIEALKYYLILARDLQVIKIEEEFFSSVDEIGRMLTGLVRSAKIKP